MVRIKQRLCTIKFIIKSIHLLLVFHDVLQPKFIQWVITGNENKKTNTYDIPLLNHCDIMHLVIMPTQLVTPV